MKIDGIVPVPELGDIARIAQQMEELGFDGLFTSELRRDPFLPLAIAAGTTSRIDLGTSIAVAFPRSPMHLAQVSRDLQAYSQGRFILGLGSQVKAHVERRFSSTFTHPVARMRELILAMHAIWRCWDEGEPLKFEGDFYRHTLMTPMFHPGPSGFGPPRVFLAAVGARMTEIVGEVADGLLIHGFSTERSLREHTIPSLERGLAKAGRTRGDIELSYPVFVITGDDEEMKASASAVREQVAFYGSTPAYRHVLELHGWGDLQDELYALSKQGQWQEMGLRITDEMLDAFAVRGSVDELPNIIEQRYGDLIDRVALASPERPDPNQWASLLHSYTNRSA